MSDTNSKIDMGQEEMANLFMAASTAALVGLGTLVEELKPVIGERATDRVLETAAKRISDMPLQPPVRDMLLRFLRAQV